MRAHLLNWALGCAFLGFGLGSSGFDPASRIRSLGEAIRGIGLIAGFVAVATTFLALFMTAWLRLSERGAWSTIRTEVAIFAIRSLILFIVIVAAIALYQFAGWVVGGWQAGLTGAAVGTLAGAAIGLAAGLGVARLGITERMGVRREGS